MGAIEKAVGSPYSDVLIGNPAAHSLEGGPGGNDRLLAAGNVGALVRELGGEAG